jgi:transposase
MYLFHKIRRLGKQGCNKSEIARKIGLNRKTVSKYLASNTPPQYPDRGRTRSNPFKGFESRAQFWLGHNPETTAREIYELLVEDGYRGSERTVNRRVAEIVAQNPKERFFEQEYEPGEQSQFDFKESVELPFIEGPRLINLHFGTLPFSDVCWIRGYPFRTYECFMDGVHQFFEKIGGQTENIRIDNLSPCVIQIKSGRKRKYTKSFTKAIEYYGFGILPCSAGKGNEKGDVERDIRTHALRIKNLVKNKGVIFKDWNHLNQWLEGYISIRQSEETKALFAEEKKSLLPFPPWDEQVLCKVEPVGASPFGTVRYEKSTYSVPDAAIGASCRIVVGAFDVKIYRAGLGNELIAMHPRKPDGEHSILLEHVLPSLIRKPQAMVRWAHREILFPSVTFKKFYQQLKNQDPDGAERDFLRCINLVQHTTLSEIETAMEILLENGGNDLFEQLRSLLLGQSHDSVIDISHRFCQQPISPALPVYDSLIPNNMEQYL